MAKKDLDENLVDVGQVYSKTEDYVNRNGKIIGGLVVGALLLVAAFFLYKKVIVEPKNDDAQHKIWKAQYLFKIDSLDLALNGDDENYYGFAELATDYAGTSTGNLANFYAGIISLRKGSFADAESYLSSCSFSDSNVILEALRLGGLGDASIEQGDVQKGIDFFKKSISFSGNTATAPIYLKKMGLAYESLGNPSGALEAYETLKRDFNLSPEARSIDKYISILEAAK